MTVQKKLGNRRDGLMNAVICSYGGDGNTQLMLSKYLKYFFFNLSV